MMTTFLACGVLAGEEPPVCLIAQAVDNVSQLCSCAIHVQADGADVTQGAASCY